MPSVAQSTWVHTVVFSEVRVTQSLVFCKMFSRSLSFLFWALYCLFFWLPTPSDYLPLLITYLFFWLPTPLLSSNFSCRLCGNRVFPMKYHFHWEIVIFLCPVGSEYWYLYFKQNLHKNHYLMERNCKWHIIVKKLLKFSILQGLQRVKFADDVVGALLKEIKQLASHKK